MQIPIFAKDTRANRLSGSSIEKPLPPEIFDSATGRRSPPNPLPHKADDL